ncbi:A24 family peptidase [Rhodoplanes sp. TEM]|uniref:A24 family peptidase n=1 Tax=Rhodoplanes tepidamans TaxID=200616 RepID=A0ABT5JC69_RHOTP|nr:MULTISPECIES: A24 family peptidase [Rhodoplanes]MDC7787284.1 A24 family peptidase [Rhodoplanes tepidamans]MDC7985312.1 A24 family peptidase [Rhodoplanes sp. TEM]MDQ0357819.1 leader peptidase (prepilin peptidase)/N-methyltransferase [Rhodoplanes tepidamans]
MPAALRNALATIGGDLRDGAVVPAVAAGTCGAAASLWIEPGPGGLLAAGLAAVAVAIAAIDARRFVIPDALSATGLVLGLLYVWTTDPWPVDALTAALLRGAALALVFLLLRIGYRRLRGRDGLGLGDVKLAAMAGVWLDVPAIPVAVEIAALAGLAAYGVRQLRSGGPMRATARLPFGLFFAPAIWIAWIVQRWLFEG